MTETGPESALPAACPLNDRVWSTPSRRAGRAAGVRERRRAPEGPGASLPLVMSPGQLMTPAKDRAPSSTRVLPQRRRRRELLLGPSTAPLAQASSPTLAGSHAASADMSVGSRRAAPSRTVLPHARPGSWDAPPAGSADGAGSGSASVSKGLRGRGWEDAFAGANCFIASLNLPRT